MSKYTNYKDSGIEWLGQIPTHWEVKKLKYSVVISNGQDYKHVEDDDGIYPVIGSGGEFARSNAYLYSGESILLGRKGTIDKPLYFIGNFWTVDTMFYTKISPSSCGKFIYYQCINIDFNRYITSTALPSMTQLDLNNIALASPPLQEQQQIAEYLDQQTAKIDELVQKQNKLIELLQAKKKSLINHVVTKGLNPDVQMKDSGIEWLGQIPEYWEVKKLKYSVVISNGQDYKHVEDDDGIYPVIGSGGEFARSNAYLYSGESILLGRKGTIDKPLYFIGNFWTVDTMFYTKISPSSCGKFIYYQCINIDFNRYITSTALPSMTQLDLNNIALASPPLQEQQQIADYLDQQTVKIDNLINKAKSMVELLKEHKQSLINNVITGKIKVTKDDAQ